MNQEPILLQPEPVIPPPPTRKFNPILILAAVILLLAVGAGGILLGKSLNTSGSIQIPTPTPDLTNNWKTYTDNKYFSVKYPLLWTEKDENIGGTYLSRVRFFGEDYRIGAEFLVNKKEAYEEFTKSALENTGNLAQAKSMLLDGVNVLRYDGYGGEASSSRNFIITAIKDGNAFLIIFSTPALQSGKEDVSVFEQMLSTFKFLDQDRAGIIASWKTYTGRDFSIKYPSEYSYQEVNSPISPEYPKIISSVMFQNQNINISFTVADNSLNLTLDTALGQGPETRYSRDFLFGKKIENVQIDNVAAVKVNNLPVGQFGSLSDLIMFKNNKIYQITLSPSTAASEKVLSQILFTFKFLSLSNPNPTPSLIEYINKKVGFSVKYPRGWFSNDCGFTDVLLLLDPNGKPVCETEPYNPIILNTKPVYIESYTQPDFKVTLKEEKTAPVKYSKFLVEKLQPAPGVDKFLILRALLPNGVMFTITVNDLQYESIADQILSTFKFLD